MDLIRNALREIATTDRMQATHFSKVLQTLKLSVQHIQKTVHQTVQANLHSGQRVKPEHTLAIDRLNQLLDKATPQAPSTRLTHKDETILIDESVKKAILATQPSRSLR